MYADMTYGQNHKLCVGWREWLALPELGIPAIKAKIDTGARTSALHTFTLQTFRANGRLQVRFGIHPLQRRKDIKIICIADVIGRLDLPLVYRGDALFPIARFDRSSAIEDALEAFQRDPELHADLEPSDRLNSI